jgi:D-alanyl-lipoteichoic acid acyltransferase DltB (MBOAT superfamily)
MLFQSQPFILIFLPLAVCTYYAFARSEAWRQIVLIVASLAFYGWWDVRFIPLLLGQIGGTYFLAVAGQRLRSAVPLYLAVALNIASLATFKYLDFLLGSVESLTGIALPRAHLILPIGISFFSFQLISYAVDRMRRDAPIYPLRQFALFVLLFPHLIAGPIVRHNELVPQFALDPLRAGLWARIGTGLTLFSIGLGKKVLLADRLAGIADPLFSAALQRNLTFAEAWNAALAFSFQLFLDFSAYTEMAIGIALLFGLVLPENFRRPYLATDLRDFWRRWHISLSKFIRDYLYIPLGGSRHGTVRYVGATLATMAICGLWHGAGWTYVAWGVWHGVGLIVCHAWQRRKRPLPVIAAWPVTMLFVLAGWILFRAANFSTAASILGSTIGLHGSGGPFTGTLLILAAAAVSALLPSAHEIKDRWAQPSLAAAIAFGLLAAACVLDVGNGPPLSFIYFQF